jgi:hypothetical protein
MADARESGVRLKTPVFSVRAAVMLATPQTIRCEQVAHATPGPLRVVPDVADTIVVIGALGDLTLGNLSARLRASPTHDELQDALRIPSIAAIIIEDRRIALAPDGPLHAIRRERPKVPAIVVDDDGSALVARALHKAGACRAFGPRRARLDQAAVFAHEAATKAEINRRVLDARAVEWDLTPREAELTYLASMILSRDRVKELFRARGFDAQLGSAMATRRVRRRCVPQRSWVCRQRRTLDGRWTRRRASGRRGSRRNRSSG